MEESSSPARAPSLASARIGIRNADLWSVLSLTTRSDELCRTTSQRSAQTNVSELFQYLVLGTSPRNVTLLVFFNLWTTTVQTALKMYKLQPKQHAFTLLTKCGTIAQPQITFQIPGGNQGTQALCYHIPSTSKHRLSQKLLLQKGNVALLRLNQEPHKSSSRKPNKQP